MPRIPYQSAQSMLPVRTYGGKVSPYETGMPQMGGGLEVLANITEGFQKKMQEAEDTRQESNAKTILAEKIGAFKDNIQNNVKVWDEGLLQRGEEEIDNIGKTIFDSIKSERVKTALQPEITGVLANVKAEFHYKHNVLHADSLLADGLSNIDKKERLLAKATTPKESEALRLGIREDLDGLVRSGAMSQVKAYEILKSSDQNVLTFKAQSMIDDNPDNFLKLADQRAFDLIYERLPQLREHAENKIFKNIQLADRAEAKAKDKKFDDLMISIAEANKRGMMVDEDKISYKGLSGQDAASLRTFIQSCNNDVMTGEGNITRNGLEAFRNVDLLRYQGKTSEAKQKLMESKKEIPYSMWSKKYEDIQKGLSEFEKHQMTMINEFFEQSSIAGFVNTADKQKIIMLVDEDIARGKRNPEEKVSMVQEYTNIFNNEGIRRKLWGQGMKAPGIFSDADIVGYIGKKISESYFEPAPRTKEEKEFVSVASKLRDDPEMPGNTTESFIVKSGGDTNKLNELVSDYKNRMGKLQEKGTGQVDENEYYTLKELLTKTPTYEKRLKVIKDVQKKEEKFADELGQTFLIDLPNFLIKQPLFAYENALVAGKRIEEFLNRKTTVRKKKD